MKFKSYDKFITVYGDVKIRLKGYYKYRFLFVPVNKESEIKQIIIGGETDSIYRLDIDVEESHTIAEFFDTLNSVYWKDGSCTNFAY